MTHDYDGPWWETYLTLEEWARIPSDRRAWYQPDSPEEIDDRQQTEHEMGQELLLMLSALSHRQQQVMQLYCLEGRTQVEVASDLGISQQTVSQHLMGKLRGGRRIGGAFRRLRKAIHKEAQARAGRCDRRTRILSIFDELLDSTVTRRRARELVNTLTREARKKIPEEK